MGKAHSFTWANYVEHRTTLPEWNYVACGLLFTGIVCMAVCLLQGHGAVGLAIQSNTTLALELTAKYPQF